MLTRASWPPWPRDNTPELAMQAHGRQDCASSMSNEKYCEYNGTEEKLMNDVDRCRTDTAHGVASFYKTGRPPLFFVGQAAEPENQQKGTSALMLRINHGAAKGWFEVDQAGEQHYCAASQECGAPRSTMIRTDGTGGRPPGRRPGRRSNGVPFLLGQRRRNGTERNGTEQQLCLYSYQRRACRTVAFVPWYL